ncbi:aminopeptidase P family protein [Clostridium sp. Marseille-Q2269]|uniref:aminopeptidase P family protein n=1 Tax=Clostridium sp. Marseille-Q2269 TaxID=2942205 RepID=UPI0020730271|nr:aminopeptidase P family protein [Clostridium sp. Marseille-Q2269]
MDKEFFKRNRKNLGNTIKEGIIIIFAGKAPYKSADETYPFTPNRNFYYLTGIEEEKIILVITKKNDKINEHLYIQRPDPVMARWVGETVSEDRAKKVSGIENIEYIDKFFDDFPSLINRSGFKKVYLDLERREWEENFTPAQIFASELKNKYPYVKIKNIYKDICHLRAIKSKEEIELIKKAIDITKEGIYNMMKNIKPNMMEYEVEAYFDFSLKKNGVTDFAFKTIAASGKNATVLHYSKNNCKVQDKSLMLCDLGAQYKYYNGDITRTFPANGKFTERQKEVYEAVLKANKAIIENAKPGITFKEMEDITKKILTEGCKKLGILKDEKELRKYYFHSFGHYLGLDTHDVGSYDLELKPGMVITNEPGLYIEEEGIGVRIEDDLLITENGCEVLSKDIIKSIEEIENFMK